MTESTDNSTYEVDSLDKFVLILTDWHNRQVATLRHFQEVPEGSQIQVDDGEYITLEGDILAGVKAGISLSLLLLGKLPFGYELEPETATEEPKSESNS